MEHSVSEKLIVP